MAPATRSRLRAPERRTLVEAAAAKLFAARGYAGTRLDDVAAEAGVTKPVLYRHFASKKALYLFLLERHQERQAAFRAPAAASGSGGAPLERVLEHWFAGVQEHPETWLMIFRDTTGDAEIQGARQAAQASARAGLAAFLVPQADGRLTDQEIDTAAELLRSAMAGLALWSLEHPEVTCRQLADLVDRAVRGLLSPPPRPS
jgi:AcrR family transcriptional regulator